MFSSIMKVIPKLDQASLRSMERSLQSRFTKLAKGFGKGLVAAVKGGGVAGLALSLIDKLLNPLKETQEAIDKSLQASDNIATNAAHFNTTSGRLLKAVAIGKSTGLDQDSLFVLLEKFQGAVSEAKQDPTKPTAVRNFMDKKDTVENFFDFMDSLRKMDTNKQNTIQQAVFGERQILKMADFLQTDLRAQYAKLGLGKYDTAKLTRDNNKVGDIADRTDELTAIRELDDISRKAAVMNMGLATAKDRSERILLQKENQRIANYKNLAAISDTVEKMMGVVEGAVSLIGGFIPKATKFFDDIIAKVDGILKSPWLRGMFGKKDK